MKRLLSLSDFLHVVNLTLNPYKKVLDYDRFLRQKLALWMFVPCDAEGKVLKEPEQYLGALEFAQGEDYENALNYKEACDRVLFEGFEIVSFDSMHVKNNNIFIGVGFKNGIFQTVEDLVMRPNWPKKESIKLTPTAQKLIC